MFFHLGNFIVRIPLDWHCNFLVAKIRRINLSPNKINKINNAFYDIYALVEVYWEKYSVHSSFSIRWNSWINTVRAHST